jgi:hypothetical protein
MKQNNTIAVAPANTGFSILVSEANTKKGVVGVHHIYTGSEEFYVITLNDDKSNCKGVLSTETNLKEGLAFARGIWKGIEILS